MAVVLPDPRDKPTMSAQEVGRLLNVGEKAIRSAMSRGELPCIKVGRFFRCPTAALRRLLEVDQ